MIVIVDKEDKTKVLFNVMFFQITSNKLLIRSDSKGMIEDYYLSDYKEIIIDGRTYWKNKGE